MAVETQLFMAVRCEPNGREYFDPRIAGHDPARPLDIVRSEQRRIPEDYKEYPFVRIARVRIIEDAE